MLRLFLSQYSTIGSPLTSSITKNGRPAAILINVDEYTRLKETVDVLSDPGLMSQIAESRAFYKTKHKGLSFEDVFGEPLTPVKKRRTA